MGYLDELIEQERDPLPYLGAAGTAAALGYGAYRTAPYYKAKADNLGSGVQALDNESPDLHILNGVHSSVDPDVGPRVKMMMYDPVVNGVESGDGSRWRAAIHSRKPSFIAEVVNSGHLDSVGRKAPFTAVGSLPTKDLDSWGEALKAKMHEDATVYGRTLDPEDVDHVVDSLVDRHRKNIFRRAASLAEDVSDLPGRIAKTLFKTSQDKSINPYLKLAYNHGAQQAIADLGLSKLGALGISIGRVIDDVYTLDKATRLRRALKIAPIDIADTLKRHIRKDSSISPMTYLERAALGGLAGGAAGGLASDEDNTLEGVLLGGALGASGGALSKLTRDKVYGRNNLHRLEELRNMKSLGWSFHDSLGPVASIVASPFIDFATKARRSLADDIPADLMLASAALTGAGTLGAGILGGRLSNEDLDI